MNKYALFITYPLQICLPPFPLHPPPTLPSPNIFDTAKIWSFSRLSFFTVNISYYSSYYMMKNTYYYVNVFIQTSYKPLLNISPPPPSSTPSPSPASLVALVPWRNQYSAGAAAASSASFYRV